MQDECVVKNRTSQAQTDQTDIVASKSTANMNRHNDRSAKRGDLNQPSGVSELWLRMRVGSRAREKVNFDNAFPKFDQLLKH